MPDISRRKFLKVGLAAGVAAGAMMNPIPAGGRSKNKKKAAAELRPLAGRVLVIAFDGIRVDGLAQARTPNLDALVAAGAASMTTRDVMPSVTLPNFTSMLTGAGPEVHGVDRNKWTPDNFRLAAVETDADGYFPSVFKVLKDGIEGMRTAFYWNWKPLIRPYNQKYFDDTLFAEKDAYEPLFSRTKEFFAAHRNEPSMVFLYTVHTDHSGHKFEWMSPEYIKAIEDGDAAVGDLVAFLKENGMYDDTHIFFVTDHGGIGKNHGGVSPEEMIVPWIVEGPGIKKHFTIKEANNTVNLASTIVRLFGLEQPLCWTGEVPESIFK